MSRDHNRDLGFNNASAGPSRINRVGGSVDERQGTIASNAGLGAPPRTAGVVRQQGASGRGSSKTIAMLRDLQLQGQQRGQAIEQARPPISQVLTQVVQRLNATSGIARGPERAQLNNSTVPRAQKSAQANLLPTQRAYPAAAGVSNKGPSNPVVMVSKSAKALIFPYPHDQDALQELRTRSNKRAREAGTFADDDVPAPRRAPGRIATAHQRPFRMRPAGEQPAKRARTPNVHLDQRMALRIDGEIVDEGPGLSRGSVSPRGGSGSDMDVDEDEEPPSPPGLTRARKTLSLAATQIGRKSARTTIPSTPTVASSSSSGSSPEPPYLTGRTRTVSRKVGKSAGAFKAARKTEFIPTDSEDDSEDKSDSDESDSSSSSRRTAQAPADDSDEEHEPDVKQEEDEDAGLRRFGPPELIRLDSPPPITIPLPQINSEIPGNPFPPRLVAALSSLLPVVTPLRLHEARRLPFLVRNLRKGFLLRCKSVGVDLTRSLENIALNVKFQHVDNVEHSIQIKKWKCPICSLHGEFPNQGVLASHLEWDHAELFTEWQQHKSNSWSLNILVSEGVPPSHIPPGDVDMDAETPEVGRPSGLSVEQQKSLFPSVTLSPPASPRPSTSSSAEPVSLPPGSPTPETSASPAPTSVTSSTLTSTPTPFIDIKGKGKQKMRYQPTPSTTTGSTRGQSTTATGTSTTARSSATASTTRMPPTAFVGPDGKRYPTPPPPENPLGPSARRPYLPAKPMYPGGQTVYYSCRPGGETLYDLLNTLSMEPYGVLEWAVLDKEEEIFESDEVKDEYKVMHALWARWIFLNRSQFLASYYKGTASFLDEYWKMIHRAAGWDALRYWLLILLANRFLTAKEVATLLKRYEAYIGMDHWNLE